jgi:hypothetical protein
MHSKPEFGAATCASALGWVFGLVLAAIAGVANAGTPNTEEYCLRGSGTGTSWDWEVRNDGLLTVQHLDSGLSVSGTSTMVRDAFIASINAQGVTTPYLTARAVSPIPSQCLLGDVSFSISGQNPFDLWVLASGAGMTIVGPFPTNTVTFNPDIDLPEPSASVMLASGVATLLALRRFRGR